VLQLKSEVYETRPDPINIPAPISSSAVSLTPHVNVSMSMGVGAPQALQAVGHQPATQTAVDLESFLSFAMNDSVADPTLHSGNTLHYGNTLHSGNTLHYGNDELETSQWQTPVDAMSLLGCSVVDSLHQEYG
jgi:hypothetical protein